MLLFTLRTYLLIFWSKWRIRRCDELTPEVRKALREVAKQEKLIAEPFAKQTELDEKRKRYNEVMEILNPKEEQALDSADEDTVQEQSRDYLKGDKNEGNLDNYSDGEGHIQKLAKEELRQSIGNFSMADRHGDQIGNDQSRSGSGIFYKDSEGVSVSRKIASLLSKTKGLIELHPMANI